MIVWELETIDLGRYVLDADARPPRSVFRSLVCLIPLVREGEKVRAATPEEAKPMQRFVDVDELLVRALGPLGNLERRKEDERAAREMLEAVAPPPAATPPGAGGNQCIGCGAPTNAKLNEHDFALCEKCEAEVTVPRDGGEPMQWSMAMTRPQLIRAIAGKARATRCWRRGQRMRKRRHKRKRAAERWLGWSLS